MKGKLVKKSTEQRDKIIQSIKQTEWDVVIVTEDTGLGVNISRKYKLDKNNCLILKRI